MQGRHYIIFGAGLLIGVAVFAIQAFNRPHQFEGSYFDSPAPAPDFLLIDVNGQDFALNDHQDQVVLMFFGYTSCPDVCPVTLSDFKTVKTELGDRSDQVSFVFITVDPERDTPQRIRQYLSNFDPDFIGLTGSREDLEPVWSDYGVYQEKVESGSAAGYLVDHSSRVYAIDKKGSLRVTYLFGTDVDSIAADVRYLLSE